jgi:hypothetical protein
MAKPRQELSEEDEALAENMSAQTGPGRRIKGTCALFKYQR